MEPFLLLFLSIFFSLVSATSAAFLASTAPAPASSSAFSPPCSNFRYSSAAESVKLKAHAVIVGKIILDKYGPPKDDGDDDSGVTIGGGGPQAAWGAAASLAVREYLSHAAKTSKMNDESMSILFNTKHQVTFLAPVGTKNWTPSMTEQLSQLLPPAVRVVLVPSSDHITPVINIWHDERENVRWLPLDGSFESIGADGLWQNRPSSRDILNVIQNDKENEDIILHAIVESGNKPTGQGMDSLPFFDELLMSRVSAAGIEPIVFADDVRGKVSCEDSLAVTATIRKIRKAFFDARARGKETNGHNNRSLFVVTPDRPCYEGMASNTDFDVNESENDDNNEFEMIIRDGGNGSFTNEMKMPAATLRTLDKAPVNPTGAGNAFSAAYVVCRGTGSSPKEAACLATAVGAVVCEYEHLPSPWSFEVVERVAEAVCEVQSKYND